jgi:hypothetical protein
MAYEEPKIRRNDTDGEDRPKRYSHDECIENAKKSGNYERTDAYAEGVGYLGVDDMDRIRRRKLR